MVNQPEQAQVAQTDKLPGVIALLKEGWGMYKERVWAILSAMIFPFFISLAVIAIFGLLFAVAGGAAMTAGKFGYIYALLPLGIIAILFVVFLQVMFEVAFVLVVEPSKPRRFLQAVKDARSLVFGYLFVTVIFTAIIFSGLVLLIIPAVVFFVWYRQTVYVRLYEGEKGIRAMQKSHWYVQGKFWVVLGRIIGIALLTIVPMMVLSRITESIGNEGGVAVFAILITLVNLFLVQPVVFCALVSLYAHLRQAKGQAVFTPSDTERKWIIAGAVVIPAIALIAAAVFAPMAYEAFRNIPPWEGMSSEYQYEL